MDIKDSSTRVKEYYKLYWQLKTKLLEEQILGETGDTENVPVIKSKSDNILKEHTNILSENNSCISKPPCGNVLRNSNENSLKNSKENVLSPTMAQKPDPKAWGNHLNRSKTFSSADQDKIQSMSFNISEKLFEGSKFKKRNPRKSFSFNKSKSNLSLLCEETSTFDSGEGSFQTGMSPITDTQDDLAPEQSFSVENDCSPKIKALITSKTAISPLFAEKIRIVPESKSVVNQPVSLIQKVVSEPTKVMKSMRKLDMKWVERCTEVGNKQQPRLSSDSGFESMESSLQLSSETCQEASKGEETSDDEIIGESDHEQDDAQQGFSFAFLSQKRKSEVLDASSSINTTLVAEQLPVEEQSHGLIMEQAAKRQKQDLYEFPNDSPKANDPVGLKKAALQRKMRMGTLNENFVKINLKKKVFVRGKKNFNFSKHKKQQWKNKKKNLDDREIGGVVRCYKCGDVGHFARYCQKILQDKLLPEELDEAEEDSGLPTLEEAEAMASEKADNFRLKRKNVLIPSEPVQVSRPRFGPVDVTLWKTGPVKNHF